ncbi:MAG: hypothetical protein RMI45_00835 [Ignisphaera sp.]|nr:hypothetical protein [Ignisphaera sp.]MDW8084771.1 hypothetical protein [Ignisphaera sp.]
MYNTILVDVEKQVVDLGEDAVDRLLHNIVLQMERTGLRGSLNRVSCDKLYITPHSGIVTERDLEVLTRVFGIRRIHAAVRISTDVDSITGAVCGLLKPGDSISIDVRDGDLPSLESLKRSLVEGIKKCAKYVEVSAAERGGIVSLEIFGSNAFISATEYEGAGGIPYGFVGRVASLLSGGIDSTIATWIVMRMGFSVTPIHFSLHPFYGDDAWTRVLYSLNWLREWVAEDVWEAYVVPLGTIHRGVDIDHRYRCILCKLLMYRISWELATRIGCRALVTGEALGQVASQTLHNLRFLSEKSGVPVIRPLVAFDKDEIVGIGRRLRVSEALLKRVKSCTLYPALWGRQATTHANDRIYRAIEDAVRKSEFGSIDGIVSHAINNTKKMVL